MRERRLTLVWVVALAVVLTAVIAWPVLRAPSTRIFGLESVGRHHDPFTVMRQFEHPVVTGTYAQPVTDILGAAIARFTGDVAAYNWLVLLTFPFAAVTAFALARHVGLSPAGAAFVAVAFAFSPFHIAHAAYHPQVAQVQWIPLYVLVLFRALDDATPMRLAALVAGVIAVTFSNFYGGLIAAVMTPFAMAAYWQTRTRFTPQGTRSLLRTTAMFGAFATAAVAYLWVTSPVLLQHPEVFAFPRSDAFKYSAKWWSYLVPPLANPWWGRAAADIWARADVVEGLLEQQVTLGAGVIVLAIVACAAWLRERHAIARSAVPMLAILASVALMCSLSPERVIAGVTVVRPSSWLFALAPMFRSYARFGVVVQLMAVMLAALGLEALWRTHRGIARVAAVALVVLTIGEYAVRPSAMSRDVLPTRGHRWLMEHDGRVRALDCVPLSVESENVQWLSANRIALACGDVSDCRAPRFVDNLAANGFTHLIVRADSYDDRWPPAAALPDGLELMATFPDSRVFAVTAPVPAIYTAMTDGFNRRENDTAWSYRWMADDASWTVVNTGRQIVPAALAIEIAAFHDTRQLLLQLDGHDISVITATKDRQRIDVPAFELAPGRHTLTFHSIQPAPVARDVIGNNDPRQLSFAIGAWQWTARRAR